MDETVVLAHGLGSGKADMLHIAGAMRGAGYNVLVFDLRAHGESGGQLCSFGVAEARDVEAAASWVREAHPEESRRLLGLGASMGAAAMLAARDAETGETPFDAIAVMGTYDDLGSMASTIIRRQFWGPLARVAEWTAIPAASAHAGYDLAAFRPADHIQENWPSPMFVAHGERDEIIPFRSGVRLYNAAFEPKRNWWVDLSHNQILGDPSTMRAVLKFFEDAELVQRGIV
jgi:alpha-beta hydrolase superfamily lysophospholipase